MATGTTKRGKRTSKKPVKEYCEGSPRNSWVLYLTNNVAGLCDEPKSYRLRIADMLELNITSSRYCRHKTLGQGWFTYHCRWLDLNFDRNFHALNEKYNFYQIHGWYSKDGALTKGYYVTPFYADLYREWQRSEPPKDDWRYTSTGGRARITPAMKSIKSRDFNGNHPKHKHSCPIAVKIDPVKVLHAQHTYTGLALDYLEECPFTPKTRIQHYINSVFQAVPEDKRSYWLDHRLYFADGLSFELRSDELPGNYIAQLYEEKANGRLYGASAIHLQSCPRELRNILFEGCWKTDIENCHFTILYQIMHNQHGIELPAVRHYLENKRQVRQELAEHVGRTVDEVKPCMLALVYGARMISKPYWDPKARKWIEAAITDTLGSEEAAEKLINHPTFIKLHQDVSKARKTIVEALRAASRKELGVTAGFISNAMGKLISKKAAPEEILSFLLQGWDARMLSIMLQYCGQDIAVCLHDGVISYKELDTTLLEDKLYLLTGFKISLESSQILIPEIH